MSVEDKSFEEMPAVNGVDWRTGQPLQPVDPCALADLDEDPDAVRRRRPLSFELLARELSDPDDLTQTGWGVLFGPRTSGDVRAAVQPLLDLRRSQARPFVVFDEGRRYRPGDTAVAWLERQGVTLATVDPSNGVPFYVLIVASPDDIPFEFQYLLDIYWAVGRLHFDSVEAYASYARRVVEYERADSLLHTRKAAIFAPRNDGDRATAFLTEQVARPLSEGDLNHPPLGKRQGFTLASAIGSDATKDALRAILHGHDGGRPAFLFTGSHGAYADDLVAGRHEKIGAIVTQEWIPGAALSNSTCYSAEDVQADGVDAGGLIHFFFACYSAGCPEFDTYTREDNGSKRRLAPATFVSRLPQRLLERGALAVLGHVDRAFAYSFQTSRMSPQIQEMRGLMAGILSGWRIGNATDQFNVRWAALSAVLSETLRDRRDDATSISDVVLANRWVARDDARNYVILGDPAVRLRVEAMA